jgi:hypothetical protein
MIKLFLSTSEFIRRNIDGFHYAVSNLFAFIVGFIFLCLIALVCIFGIAAIDKRMEEATIEEML